MATVGIISLEDKKRLDLLWEHFIAREEVEMQYVLQNMFEEYIPNPVPGATADKNGNDIALTYERIDEADSDFFYEIEEQDDEIDFLNKNGIIKASIPYILTQLNDAYTDKNGVCITRHSDDLEPEDQAFFTAAETEVTSGIKIGTQTFTVIGTLYYILNPGEQSATINMEMI